MQGLNQPSESTHADPSETARDRVKKMLQREAEKDAETTVDSDMADAEDDEDLSVLPRRRQRREANSPSPINSQQANRSLSPGLFVSSPARPSRTKSSHNSDSEDDLPTLQSDRFKALVERKRQERLAREAEEEARDAERRARQEKLASELEQFDSDEGNVSDIIDDEGGRKLTQGARPTRKASKKAIEEMNRETQRMARNMQLAHEAKTRKKISKSSLFERFNFRPAGELAPPAASSSRPATPHSDAEMDDTDTPPSSPPVAKQPALPEHTEMAIDTVSGDEELPSLGDVIESTKIRIDKGKGKAVDVPEEQEKPVTKSKRHVRVRFPVAATKMALFDSDDELEITKTSKAKIDAVFDSIPAKKAQESHSLLALRALAHVKLPSNEARRKDENRGMTVGELQSYLQQKAREQAKLERARRVEALKAQGIVVQTAEERERQMQDVEDIVAKAREEAEKIMHQERADAKKEKGENGEVDPLAWDESDDEDYEDPANEADTEASAVELSGSEDDEDEEDEGNPMFEDQAEDAQSEVSEDNEDSELPVLNKRRARKNITIISDDEDSDDIEDMDATPKPKASNKDVSPIVPSTVSPRAPTSVLRSAKKNFIPGLPVQGPAGLGLTQIFAGTMDDSQMDSASGPTQSMMPDFDNFPDSNFSATMDEPVEDMILDSQNDDTQKTTQGIQLNFSQSQMRGLDSLWREDQATQLTDFIEPTQDGGFQQQTPLKERFVEPPQATVDTVMISQLDDAVPESPLVRRGRLRQRGESALRIEETPEPVSTEKSQTAFGFMKEGAQKEKKRQQLEEFNRKKSKAKEMIQEQAEESEDEYAGLGGADGEDSDNESLASVKEMIDDAARTDVDEAKLAAFYA